MLAGTDVLLFVEDPGPAAYLAPVPGALEAAGHRCVMLAAGLARQQLQHDRVEYVEPVPGSTALELLESYRPRVLLTGTAENPDTLGLQLIAASRHMHISSVGAVDAAMNSERRFRGRDATAFAFAPDWLIVPDEWTRDAFVALGYPQDRAVVCGHPHYDRLRETRKRFAAQDRDRLRQRAVPGVAPGQKIIVFADEGSARLGADAVDFLAQCAFQGRGGASGRTEIVLEEFLAAVPMLPEKPCLVLRIHPKDTPQDFAPYLPEFDFISDGGSPLELAFAADLVVGMSSMLVLESALLGTPTLAVIPRSAEIGWLPSVRAGVTPCATSRDELRRGLLEWSRLPDRKAPDFPPGFIIHGAAKRIAALAGRLLHPAAHSDAFRGRRRNG